MKNVIKRELTSCNSTYFTWKKHKECFSSDLIISFFIHVDFMLQKIWAENDLNYQLAIFYQNEMYSKLLSPQTCNF